jgi:hypothetical protein
VQEALACGGSVTVVLAGEATYRFPGTRNPAAGCLRG